MNASFKRNTIWPTDGEPPLACATCDFGRDLATGEAERGQLCRHPQVRTDCNAARLRGGACGPEANYLTIKGDELCP